MSFLIALLSAALPMQTDRARVHLVPAGEFAGVDGRPAPGRKWKLSNVQGAALATLLNARHQRVAFQFDYEHQSFLVEKNGQPAPSAGWGQTFEWLDGQGLFITDVTWTKRANDFIDADEYRYISPAITYDKNTFEVNGLINASLVGTPNLYELAPVAQALARLSADLSIQLPEKTGMDEILKAILAALGLAQTATAADATSAIATLRAKADRVPELDTQVATLKAATPDAAKFVPIENFNSVNTELATLKAKASADEVDKVIAEATAAGKVASADVEVVWRNVGKSDLATLKALVDKTPANPALAGKRQTTGTPPAGQSGEQLSDAELAICRNMGIKPEDYRAAEIGATS